MEKTLYAAWREMREKRPASVYIVYHDKDGSAGSLLAETAAHSPDSHSIVRGCIRDGGLEGVLAGAWDGTLFGPPEVTLVSDFDYLATTSSRVTPEESILLERLWREPPGAPLILSTMSEKLDERRRLTKSALAASHAVVVNAAKRERGEWVRLARELASGLVLTDGQWREIADRSDLTVGMLRMELEKLKAYAGEAGCLHDEMFAALVLPESDAGIFDVAKLTAYGEWAEAYALFRRLPQDATFALLAILARQYRLIARVQEERGVADGALASRFGVHPYAVKVAREQARRFGRRECARCLTELADVEFAVKSGRLQERTALELWYLKRLAEEPARNRGGRFP
jgi:DNA polymerase-3 subunit delta